MDHRFRRQDFCAGLLLAALALFVLLECWRMPRLILGWPAYAGPGVVPGLLALGLLGMAVALLVRSVRRPGGPLAISTAEVRAYLTVPETRRFALMVGLAALYLLSLGRGLPYYLTTGSFLVVTMAVFRAARWWVILLVGGAAAAAIGIVFNEVFLVPLP
jgi:hypothetical protein